MIALIAGNKQQADRWLQDWLRDGSHGDFSDYKYIPINMPEEAYSRHFEDIYKVGTWREVWNSFSLERVERCVRKPNGEGFGGGV